MLRLLHSVCEAEIRAEFRGWKYMHGGIHNLVTIPDREDVKLVMRGRVILKWELIMLCVQVFVCCRKL